MKKLLLTALALTGFAALATAANLTDIGTTPPTPVANDISLYFAPMTYQNDDGLNYYWDSGTGETFTTLANAGGYTLTNLAVKTHGNGGGSELASQTFTLYIYSVSPDGTTATLVKAYTATGQLKSENDWLDWTGLGTPLAANTQYAFALRRGNGSWEEMANCTGNPYAGGQMCLIPAVGGAIQYGNTGSSDATFNLGLALGTVTGGTAAVTDIGGTAPTPGANDISQLLPAYYPAQANDGLNYYFDTLIGQTFTTLNSPVGYVITNLSLLTAGGGGGGELNAQGFHLYFYSLSADGTTATLLQTYTANSQLNAEGDWLQWNDLNVSLAPNSKYAYTFQRDTGGWEEMANYGGNQYPGGEICIIPAAGGSITYGSSHASDAAFDLGLAIPQVPIPTTPTYAPAVNPVYAGSPITLLEKAAGPGPLYYQWLTDNGTGGSLSPLGGFTTNRSVVVDTTAYQPVNYNFAVVVTNSFGSSTSAVVTLSITGASGPILVSDATPTPNVTVNYVGLTQQFSASIQGTLPIAYQWEYSPNGNGIPATPVAGATNSTLTLSNLQLTNTGYYSLYATNAVAPYNTSSSWEPLTVEAITNQFIAWSPLVPFTGLSAGQILTNPAGAFIEAEFFGSGGSTAGPLSVTVGAKTLVFNGDGSSASVAGSGGTGGTGGFLVGTNTTGNASFDTVLDTYAYDGASGTHTITLHNLTPGAQYAAQFFALDDRALAIGRATSFQDPNDNADLSAVINQPANEYIIGTFTANGTDVAIQQNLVTGVGTINAVVVRQVSASLPAFAAPPAPATAYAGRTVQLGAVAIGVPAPAYQWQDGSGHNLINGGQYSGVTNDILTISNLTSANNGAQYVLIATNLIGAATNPPVGLTILAAPPTSGAYSAKVLALNPVAYWPLDDNALDPGTGVAPAYDATANQHDGLYGPAALNGWSGDGIVGPQPTDGFSQFSAGQGALETTAATTNSWVIVPALNLNTNNVTITMWLNPSGSQGDFTGLLLNRNSGTQAGISYSTGQRLGYMWNNNDAGTWSYEAGPVIPTGQWSLVALVVTPTNASFYVINTNGLANTTYAYPHNPMTWGGDPGPDPQIRIGSDTDWQDRTFNGVIDEVAVFNQALTLGQIQSLSGYTFLSLDPTTAHFKAAIGGPAGSRVLNFSWAPDHATWQVYTNSVGLGAAGSWFPLSGSASVTNLSLPLDPTKTNVFYQLRYP
jgi:hypothetical protein